MYKIRPYSADSKLENFPDLFNQLETDYQLLVDEFTELTPRFWIYSSIAFKNIFYYINLLYTHNPTSVIDVGCGECIWKKYYPNIIGVDALSTEHSNEDIMDYFDSEFSKGHTKHYSCGMALGSLHFNKWGDLPDVINDAMNVVTERFLFTFNFDRLDEHSVNSNITFNTYNERTQYIEQMLSKLPYNIYMLDYADLGKTDMYNSFEQICNGHVRFILEH